MQVKEANDNEKRVKNICAYKVKPLSTPRYVAYPILDRIRELKLLMPFRDDRICKKNKVNFVKILFHWKGTAINSAPVFTSISM